MKKFLMLTLVLIQLLFSSIVVASASAPNPLASSAPAGTNVPTTDTTPERSSSH